MQTLFFKITALWHTTAEYFLKANVISVIGYHAITDFEKSAKEVKYFELIKKIYIHELKTKVQIKYGNPT